ncbi:MAG: DnaD domain protein [Anaerolineae bacterium]|nr:MAG: DnaD domain protein [Anaerolineae bacterium]
MPTFPGFTASETFTPLPDTFFHRLLREVDDLGELKVTLYALWWVAHTEGPRPLRSEDFAEGTGLTDPAQALEKAVARGTLLRVRLESETLYFANTPRGRAAVEAVREGRWRPSSKTPTPPPVRPNIFRLYEENIGPLTPLIADALRDAETTYPPDWIEEAIAIAAKMNKRNWRYVEAILRRWKEEGHAEKQTRQDVEQARRRDVEEKIRRFLEG